MSTGTPRTLHEAVERAMQNGPMATIPESVHRAVRDFLAQRFGAAMLESGSVAYEERLKRLFERIVKREAP